MVIQIYTEELPSDWQWNPTDEFKTGTTEFYVETAANLRSLGHDVIVYYDGETTDHWGVTYMNREAYEPFGVLLACNSVPKELPPHRVYWTNLFTDKIENHPEFDAHIVLSPFHKKIFGGGEIVGHGCNPERYDNQVKIEGSCLYSSSPDRGGKFLEEIWPEVEAETGAKLTMTYRKSISERVMDDLYRASQFWLHPGEGVELFCISALKAMAAGCIPVVVPNMALATTVTTGIKTTKENYKKDLINAIKNPPVIEKTYVPSWKEVTLGLEKILMSV